MFLFIFFFLFLFLLAFLFIFSKKKSSLQSGRSKVMRGTVAREHSSFSKDAAEVTSGLNDANMMSGTYGGEHHRTC